ncbi:WD40 repeat domain-containing protein [Micromonospora sp. NPDC048930]|uniref:WD40 repeat domain-containing protein n=1 Tax=Micromonospora sp. NPDC048930 TaxID=3364261 RepID=UPI003712B74B
MRELFATLPDDPPPLPPGYLDTVLTRGRRSARRHRVALTAGWAAVVLVLAALVVPGVPLPVHPEALATRPSLPDRFAGYSMLTSTVTAAPPGRAIALYGYGNGETVNMFQSLVVGADRDTYRRVDTMEERDRPSALLAPDGTRVLLGDDRGATADLILVDLATGERRSIPLGDRVGVRLLAWSPDGRHVAYSAAPLTNSGEFGTVNVVEAEVARTGTLRLLDLSTGRSTEVPAIKPAWTASFAPDSRRLAVQVGQTAHLLDLDGREYGSVQIPGGRELAAEVGWSPDGTLLATVPWLSDGPFDGTRGGDTSHGVFLWKVGDITFLPVTGTGTPPAPVPDVVQLLGWRSAGSLVVATVNDAGHASLAEVRLGAGTRRTLSHFDTGRTCELGTQSCQLFDLHLATGLLPDLTVRNAGRPQRGPWPMLVNAVLGVLVLGAAYLLWRRRRRSARR